MSDDKDLLPFIAKASDQAVFGRLGSTSSGLTGKEAALRLSRFGPNQVYLHPSMHPLIELLKDFKDPLIIILLVVAVTSFFMGEFVNAWLVLVMVCLSVILNFYQEYHATKAAEKLQARVAVHATVERDGRDETTCPAAHIVVGDLIILNAGDLIPADARILNAKDFFVNQSALTGESVPVEKSPAPVTKTNPDLNDFSNIVFSGTSVVTGTAQAVVYQTGEKTQLGHIVKHLNQADEDNDFTQGIKQFSRFLARVIIVFVVIIFLANTFLKHDLITSFTFAIAIAVGLTPEFLPMIMSVTMGKGALRMASKGVIVKKLTAIPTFGSMDVLCTDKTGTLTQDKIKLVKYVTIDGSHSDDVLLHAYINSSHQTGITNPLDEAVKKYKRLDISRYHKIDEIPFDFERKRMSVVVEKSGERFIVTKGAPENILAVSALSPPAFHRSNQAIPPPLRPGLSGHRRGGKTGEYQRCSLH